ncbi:MAG: DUF1592 domain-containing protein [Polyangiaceae bacterium]|nr:DUF1592 domain-containing protein [Polyangiaceae bacterium]
MPTAPPAGWKFLASFLAAAAAGCVGDIGEPNGPASGALSCDDEGAIFPGRAPIRRLTRFEYNNTVRDLLGDDTEPANAFPSEEIGNGFGNDADAQSVSSLLAETYGSVAEDVALRATASPDAMARLDACAASITAATDAQTELACATTTIERLATGAFRRPLAEGELDELVALQQTIRAEADFRTSLAAVIEAVLQSPDFLYRVEFGEPDRDGSKLLRPTGYEMATRLSYFLWGTQPDALLLEAAASGELSTKEGVYAHASRMLDDPRSRPVVRFFFDNLLPIANLSRLERDEALFPTFSAATGALMREETQRFLEHEIFEGSGSWRAALTAPYTFVNGPLAAFYGIEGVEGDEFQKVSLDGTERSGLLLQGGMLAGTIHSNTTNPVTRGSFIVQKIMCYEIPVPTGEIAEKVKPPDPYSGATARERFLQHSADPVCASCHSLMDPVGLALENFDPVGLWRDTENGVTIDASGKVPGSIAAVTNPVELVTEIAKTEAIEVCFADNWLNFAYGRTLGAEDECTSERVHEAFAASGSDIRSLLLEITQSDAFLYLPAREE